MIRNSEAGMFSLWARAAGRVIDQKPDYLGKALKKLSTGKSDEKSKKANSKSTDKGEPSTAA